MKRLFLLSAILLVPLFFFSTATIAQFTLTGEIRPRGEFRNGFKELKSKDADPAFFVEQRTRLYFDFTKDNIQLNVALQDVRIWGSTDQIYKTDPSLDNVYEAWGKYAFDDKYGFKIGRQALNYDNARFMGNLDWAQQGRSHDALLLTREYNQSKLHLAVAYNQKVPFEPGKLYGTDYLGINNYKSMIFAWWNKKCDNGEYSLLFHNDGRQVAADTSTAYRQTYGALGNIMLGGVKLDGEFYYQGGKNSADTDVNAFMIAIHAMMKTDITPITFGFEYLSGTSTTDNTDKSFNPLYGTNHKFYGFMDYFYVGNNHGQGGKTSGLIDGHVKTNFSLGKKSNLAANLHYFASPAKIYKTPSENFGSTLGTEVDFVYSLALTKDVKFNLGYSHMFATETMEAVKGGDKSALNNWVWAMVAFKPQLFSTAKEK